jgi:hypothetical protein
MSQTRSGESGSWFGIAPSEANPLATALAISPPTGMIVPSPAPLTPRGVVGEGWFFEGHRADSRAIGRRRDQVVGQIAGLQLPVSVLDEVLHKGSAEPPHDPADCLTVQCQRIDDAADILDDQIVQQLDSTRPRVHCHMRRRR